MRKIVSLVALLLMAPALVQAQTTFNKRAVINFDAAGDNTVIAGVTGQRISIFGFDMTCAASVVATLKSGSTALTGPMTLTAYAKGLLASAPPYWVSVTPGDDFIINTVGATQCSGAIWYTQQ